MEEKRDEGHITMIIDCISDLHGHYPKLEGGDLLIIAGDLTRSDENYQYEFLYDILNEKEYKKIILIAGNHDNALQSRKVEFVEDSKIEYLCDSGTEFEFSGSLPFQLSSGDKSFVYKKTFKIWGSPWTKTFEGMNPKCKAFTVDTEEELAEKFKLIPDDIDILVTHAAPSESVGRLTNNLDVGSTSLNKKIRLIGPKIVVCGHIHEMGGIITDFYGTKLINASIVNEHYEPVNKPVRVIL